MIDDLADILYQSDALWSKVQSSSLSEINEEAAERNCASVGNNEGFIINSESCWRELQL